MKIWRMQGIQGNELRHNLKSSKRLQLPKCCDIFGHCHGGSNYLIEMQEPEGKWETIDELKTQ